MCSRNVPRKQAQKAGSDTKGKAPFDPRAVQPGTFRPSIALVSNREIVFLISFILSKCMKYVCVL